MKQVAFLTLFLFGLTQFACGQESSNKISSNDNTDDSRINIALSKANEMNDAFIKEDFSTFLNFLHPKIIEGFGGKEKFTEIARKILKDGENMKMKVISSELGDPGSVIEIENEIFIVIPYVQINQTPKGKLKDETVIIGISDRDGKDWKFVTGANKKNFGEMFPKAVDLIQLPNKKSPKWIETN